MANIILGVGALSMPMAFAQSGIISGLLLLGLMCFAGHYTALLLVKCANKIGVDSYEKLTEKILGSAGFLFFCILCAFTNIGAAVCYIMFISECTGLTSRNLVILCTLTILPLCFVKDWESLSILSKIKTFVYAMVVLFILFRPSTDIYSTDAQRTRAFGEFISDRSTWFSLNIFQSIGTFAFGTIYHDCLFPVRKTMKTKSVRDWAKTSSFTLIIVYLISTLLGVGGFINFRPISRSLGSNVFTNSEDGRLFSDDIWFKAARFMLVGLMLMTVPLCVHCSRDYIEAIITKIGALCGDKTVENEMKMHMEGGTNKQTITEMMEVEASKSKNENYALRFLRMFKMTATEYLITISLFAFSLFGSIWLSNKSGVEVIIDAIGNYALCAIGFVFPPIIFLCTFKRKEYSVWTLFMVLLILTWGLFIWFYETSHHMKLSDWKFESVPEHKMAK